MRILQKAEAERLDLVRRLYPEVLAKSFSAEELGEPWEGDHAPSGLLMVAWDEVTGSVLGCAVGETYARSRTLLIAYLAVRPGMRGEGVGSALMQAVRERWFDANTLAFAEIDDPRHHEAHDGYGDPWARLRFYERFGVKALAAPYFQPSVGPGFPREYHVMLCRVPCLRGSSPEAGVSGARVRAFVREYFTACEGPGSLKDAQVRWLLDAYSGEIKLIPLTELPRIPDSEPPPAGTRHC